MTLSIGLAVNHRDEGHVHFTVFAGSDGGREHLAITDVTRGNTGDLVWETGEFDMLVDRLRNTYGVHLDVYDQAAVEYPHPCMLKPDDRPDVHAYMGLSYANYLVLHRSVLQSMPDDWQRAFVALLEEADQMVEAHGIKIPASYHVQAIDEHDRETPDPVPHYNRGRTRLWIDSEPQRPERCPRCDSPSPERHPAVQHEGEVQPCSHGWHRLTATIQ